MQCYTELAPPSAVTCSLSMPFTSADVNNLLVGKGSLLQIFTTKTIAAEVDRPNPAALTNAAAQSQSQLATKAGVTAAASASAGGGLGEDGLEADFLGGDAVLQRADRTTHTKLVLVAEYTLSGTLLGMGRIKTVHSASGGDALLVHLRDAKLSLIEWDPAEHDITMLSVHYYEQEDLPGPPWQGPLSNYYNFLTTDPGSRCAMLKFGDRNVAILPFKQSDVDMEIGDDWDEDLDGPRPVQPPPSSSSAVAGEGRANGTSQEDQSYLPSFVLRLPQLDPNILYVAHFAFLHEYREPTFGILSSRTAPSMNLGRRDHLSYLVYTLDLQQKASTQILSVGGLPQDLERVIPLQAPVGGALLVGPDCIVHVDQSGKTNGIGVNPFSKEMTDFGLADQGDLHLRLEGCVIEPLAVETGELLLVTSDGRMGVISFRIDGRTISGMSIKMLADEAGGSLLTNGVSCITPIGKNTLFIGNRLNDSVVLGWSRKQAQLSRRKSRLIDPSIEGDFDDLDLEDDDEDDDLYGEGAVTIHGGTSGSSKQGDLILRLHDSFFSIANSRDFTAGRIGYFPESEEAKNSVGVMSDLVLACAMGSGKDGSGLAIITREIQPKVVGRFDFPEARGFWAMWVQKPIAKSLQGDKGANMAAVGTDYDPLAQYHKYMIVSKIDLDGYETSDVYALTPAGFEALTGTEFEPAAGFTVEAGTMGKHMRVIQVLKSEVRCYDGDLGLTQILPMLDEETGQEPRIISAGIADPYLLLIRDDSSVFVAQIDSSNELEEVERESDTLVSNKWLAGCLYTDSRGLFAKAQNDKGTELRDSIFMFLVNAAGALHIYALPDLSKPIYVAETLSFLPPILKAGAAVKKGSLKETLTEILVADLGDSTAQSPYLILRDANDDLTIYEPFRTPPESQSSTLSNTLRFKKIPNAFLAKSPEAAPQDDATQESRFFPMRICRNIGGLSTIFLPGSSPSFLVRSAKSTPRVIGLQGLGVRGMSPFHTEGCERGFVYADSAGIARVTQFPSDANFTDLGVSAKKILLGEDTTNVAYHNPTLTYVVACTTPEEFELPKDDDHHKEWAKENIAMRPLTERGTIKLINPLTWNAIDVVQLDECEIVLCMQTLNLEVSEETKERRLLVVIGTAVTKGEDQPTKGRIYVYDVASVIPQPGRPDTDKKLKLVAKEEIPRGGVTAISDVGQGLMIVAQGTKCMVRGLKEDGTLLPVAFMDMASYVSSLREVPGTGLLLMADAYHGVVFSGYQEEPYKLTQFAKSTPHVQAAVADFLPNGKDLYCIVATMEGELHVLQYDPDHPKSMLGNRLLYRCTFAAAPNFPTQMRLLPRTFPLGYNPPDDSSSPTSTSYDKRVNPPNILLMCSPTGQLSAMVSLSETPWRRFVSITNQLISLLPQPAALNPKAHRAAQMNARPPAVDASLGRNVVDGVVLARWNELSCKQRVEVAGKSGFGDTAEVRAELHAVLGWSGMSYF